MNPQRTAHLLVALAVIAVFARGVPYPLLTQWDDGRFIVDNPDVHAVSWQSFVAIVRGPRFEAYHPLHLLSYWLDVPWLGASGPVLHATSLLLFTAVAGLVLRAMLALGLSLPAASFATLACCLHPAQVEAVTWATGRKDVLALGFACGMLLCHARSAHALDRWAWGSRALYALGLCAKTTVLPLPLLLVAWDALLRGRSLRASLVAQLPALCIAIVAGAGVLAIWSGSGMWSDAVGGFDRIGARMSGTLAHQLMTALWPAKNAVMYDDLQLARATLPGIAVSLALVLGVLFAYTQRQRTLAFVIVGFAILWLPVSNALPMRFPLQDRYLSLPLLVLGFGAGAWLDHATMTRRRTHGSALAFACACTLALGVRTAQYVGTFRDEQRLWEHAAAVQSDSRVAWLKLGQLRRDRGELDGAITAFRTSLRLWSAPGPLSAHASLAHALELRGERAASRAAPPHHTESAR